MHDLSFAESVKPPIRIILRLPMLPYSVGHEILLLNQQNPLLFVREQFNQLSFQEQKLSIIRAALVCYRTWKKNHTFERNLWLWGWFVRRSNWSAEIAEFRNYRESGSCFPPVPKQEHYEIASGAEKDERGRELGGPYMARLVTFLSRGGLFRNLGFETPWDVPFGMANHLYLSDLEMEGSARIENSREAQVRREMDEHDRIINEENGAARTIWESCKTDDDRLIAIEKNPRIIRLFEDAAPFADQVAKRIWNSCRSDDDRRAAVQKFPHIINVVENALLFAAATIPERTGE